MRRIWLLGAAFCAWALSVGCGEDGGDDGGGNTAGSGATGGSSPGLPPGVRVVASNVTPRAGECRSSIDCGTGATCGEVPSGYRVCVANAPQATMPSANPTEDTCDASRPCTAGGCFTVEDFPNGICAAGQPRTHNVCRDNGCTQDSQCPDGICGPAGLSATERYGSANVRECIPAACRSNADCTKLAGGVCALVQAGCDLATTGGDQDYLPAQMACVYPNGCAALGDCFNVPNSVCKVIRGEGVCVVQE